MATSGPAIDVSHLTKVYGPTVALNDVTLSVGSGEVRGLLGPNGSGKSSLMKTIMGLTKPSYGSIQVLGYDVRARPMDIKKIVGYVPESPRLYEFLTATEYLDFIADVRGLPYEQKKERIARFVDALDLEGKQGDMISSLQAGKILAEGTSKDLRENAGLPGSGLEDVFLKLTGTKGVEDIVEALIR